MKNNHVIMFQCPQCREKHAFHITPRVDTRKQPELKDAIMDHSIFTFHCPNCGYMASVRYHMIYHDPVNKIIIQLTESLEQDKEIDSYLKKNYKCRNVSDPNEVGEKILIFEYGLDDRIVEIEKAMLCGKAKEKDADLSVEGMYFAPKDDGWYFIAFDSNGFISDIPFHHELYEQIKANIIPHVHPIMLKSTRISNQWAAFVLNSLEKNN